MNLYLRLLWTLIKAICSRQSHSFGQPFELKLRVWPNDLDINGHMNNGRYLTIVDLALVTLFVRSGFARLCTKNRWRPMAGGTVAHYRRGLRLFESYTLRFTPLGSDRHWNYSRFEFIRDGKICATGFTKGAAVGKEGLVLTEEYLQALGFRETAPLPPDLLTWITADRTLGEYAKSLTS